MSCKRDEAQLQIRLVTKQSINAVPDIPLSVPALIEINSLNDLVNQLLKETNVDYLKFKQFDFIINGELLRVPLVEHLQEHRLSTEITVEIEYIERCPAPEPENTLLHDDWVPSIHTSDNCILTGCYDNSVNIWTLHGKIVTNAREHSRSVKEVKWINKSDISLGFVSVSQDLTGIIWSLNQKSYSVKPKIILKGHKEGLSSIDVSQNCEKLATGSWDTNLKIWSALLGDDEDGEPEIKKSKNKSSSKNRVPLCTLSGHKEVISSINWTDNHVICSSSMDHTIKFWDADLYGIRNEIIGQKAFFGISWSPLSQTLLAASADRHIRLYDPRSSEGSVCKTIFTSHTLWIPSVKWSTVHEHHFLSGSYDSTVKLWDTRSPKAPLYDLQGHENQVLCVDWSNNKYLVSGGADNQVHIFRNKQN